MDPLHGSGEMIGPEIVSPDGNRMWWSLPGVGRLWHTIDERGDTWVIDAHGIECEVTGLDAASVLEALTVARSKAIAAIRRNGGINNELR